MPIKITFSISSIELQKGPAACLNYRLQNFFI
jgi:hypothetical protein